MINDKYITRGAYHVRWYNNKENSWYPQLVDEIVKFCKGTTLDLGCGEGLVASLIAANGYDVTAVDADSVAIAMGKYLYPSVRFIEKDIAKPTRGKFEYLACLNTIEHLDSPGPIFDILEKNITKGAIIITDKADDSRELGRGHVKEYTLGELDSLFSEYEHETFEIADDFIGVRVRKQE